MEYVDWVRGAVSSCSPAEQLLWLADALGLVEGALLLWALLPTAGFGLVALLKWAHGRDC